jgi:hypothetical protein
METIREIVAKYKKQFFSLNNVVGVGCGYKTVNGKRTDEECIVVLVEDKVEEEKLQDRHLVPQSIGEQKTDVIEIGEVELLTSGKETRTNKVRPAQPGVSIGHHKITAGTFGAVVQDKNSEDLLILSNNHVLANITNGKDGRAKKGDEILQPGSYDGGEEQDVIGHLDRFVPIYEREPSHCPLIIGFKQLLKGVNNLFNHPYEISPRAVENEVDCAVAKPKNPDLIKEEIMGLGKIKGLTEPELGMKVKKSGRTSGVTTTEIKAIDVSIKVQLSASSSAVFTNQIVTEPFSKPGDSGAVVVDDDNQAVGLLFAGSDKSTVCNDIHNVLDALEITFQGM